MSSFQRYSAFYDLLYSDKDYTVEADYVARLIRKSLPNARTILELGSGTGRHGRLLAQMGFDVYGLDSSPDMIAVARARNSHLSEMSGSFTCELGDICSANLGRTFDVVIALFHVIGYQTTNRALQAVFRVACDHLVPGGLFLFDVWHGPAVLSQGPSERVKEVADEFYRVKRTARPELDANSSTVKVVFEMECENRAAGQLVQFTEEHLVRYLFPTEVDLLAQHCGLRLAMTEEFLTGTRPSKSTWGVAYVLQR